MNKKAEKKTTAPPEIPDPKTGTFATLKGPDFTQPTMAQFKPTPPPPEEMIQLPKRKMDALQKAYKDLGKATTELQNLWGEVKEHKATVEAAQQRVNSLTAELFIVPNMPLFKPPEKPADGKAPAGAKGQADDEPIGAWGDKRIAETLDLKPRTLALLDEHKPRPIETMRDLVEHMRKHGEFWAKEIKGVGPGRAEDIEDAMAKFWAKGKAQATRPQSDESQKAVAQANQ